VGSPRPVANVGRTAGGKGAIEQGWPLWVAGGEGAPLLGVVERVSDESPICRSLALPNRRLCSTASIGKYPEPLPRLSWWT